jgi:hypothetical protein
VMLSCGDNRKLTELVSHGVSSLSEVNARSGFGLNYDVAGIEGRVDFNIGEDHLLPSTLRRCHTARSVKGLCEKQDGFEQIQSGAGQRRPRSPIRVKRRNQGSS